MIPTYIMAMAMISQITIMGSLAPEKASDTLQKQKTRQRVSKYYFAKEVEGLAYIYRRSQKWCEKYYGFINNDHAKARIEENKLGAKLIIRDKENNLIAVIWLE